MTEATVVFCDAPGCKRSYRKYGGANEGQGWRHSSVTTVGAWSGTPVRLPADFCPKHTQKVSRE
jgi:hypothetical protein